MKRIVQLILILLLTGCGGDPDYYTLPPGGGPGTHPDQEIAWSYIEPGHVNTQVDPSVLEERMLNLPPQFVRGLEGPSPRGFALLEIQSSGVSDEATSEADWGANVDESNVDYDGATNPPPEAGDVILAADTGENTTGAVYPTADVLNTNWQSGDWDSVNDPESDTNYLDALGSGGEFYGTPGSLAAIPANAHIKQIDITARMRESLGTVTGYVGYQYNGVDHWDAGRGLGGTWTDYTYTVTTNPVTSLPWKRDEILAITGIGAKISSGIGGGGQVSVVKMTVTYYDFQTSGYIEVELDLTGANTDNDMTASIDDVVPDGTSLAHELFYPSGTTGYMRPTDHQDVSSQTVNEADAYDGDDTDSATSTYNSLAGLYSMYYGRNSGSTDQWEAEPSFFGTATLKVVAERGAATGNIEMLLHVRDGANTLVATLIPAGTSAVSKATFEADVSSYVGDLSDLLVVVGRSAGSTGTQTLDVYDIWIEGELSTDGVSVDDGSRFDTLGAETVKIKSLFTSDGSATPVLKSVGLEIPDRVYRFNSFGEFILNSYPYMSETPGRAIKLDLRTWITTSSDLTVSMTKDDLVVQMLQENSFHDLNAELFLGMYSEDITESDLVRIHRLLTKDFNISGESVSIVLKDPTSNLLETKVPIGSTGTTKPTISYDGWHMVDVIIDQIDRANVRTRYINRGSFDSLRNNVGDGTPASTNYVVKRTGATVLAESRPAKDHISELNELLGSLLVVQEDGRMTAMEYDSADPAVDSWDSDDLVADPEWNPNLSDARDVCRVWFDWDGSGSDEADFASIHIVLDDTDSALVKDIKTKWIAGDAADGYYGEEIAEHVANREVNRLAGGLGKLSCSTPLNKFAVQVGDMVNVTHPDIVRNDIGTGDTVKFLVVQKDPPQGGTISWKLVEAR